MKAKKKNREKSSTYPNLRIDELLTLFDTALKSCPIACHLKLVAGQCPPGSKGILSQAFLANLNVVKLNPWLKSHGLAIALDVISTMSSDLSQPATDARGLFS